MLGGNGAREILEESVWEVANVEKGKKGLP